MKRRLIMTLLVVLFVISAYPENTSDIKNVNFQLSLISPLGTNGLNAGKTINRVSFNIVGGYSYGNTAFEFGSIYNVNLNHTSGFQFAGVVNYTKESRNAAQFAGVSNIIKKGETPFQFAGILNSTEIVSGLQFAGMVNMAKDVRGVQFGVFNYTDTCSGVPIGIFNIVRHGGKQEFEIGLSDALNTYASFKLGVDKLYTIFSAGVNFLHSKPIYGVGIGLGTDISWNRNGWANQVEAMGYSITEDGKFQKGTNILTQLKFTFSKQIRKHFKFFAGPTFNLTISDYVNPETNEIGSPLRPYSFLNNTRGKTNLKGWVGLVAGVRF